MGQALTSLWLGTKPDTFLDAAAAVREERRLYSWKPGLKVTECPVCFSDNEDSVNLGCPLAHVICLGCALRTIRSELTPEATMVRCPCCRVSQPPVETPMSEAAVDEVAAWSRHPTLGPRSDGDLRPLGPGELARFAQIEAERCAAASEAAPLPEGVFKRCPGRHADGSPCGEGIQHPRGHACHHIKPGTGCPSCHTHFCYACLGPHPCTNGCRMFCTPSVHAPTAAACDCSDCLDCAPGRPCADCDNDGRCWVCQPDRRPPPSQMP
jgi:hypothetical protein